MNKAATALRALGDDTRRQIFDQLAARPRSVSEIASGLSVTRPAVSQHLKVLKDAGLVSDRAEGRNRIYQIDPHGLAAVRAWLDEHWAQAFVAFDAFVQRTAEQGPVAKDLAAAAADSSCAAKPAKAPAGARR